MQIHPILSALRRHKTAAALIVLQVALSCAIVSNAAFLVGERITYMQRDSGVDEERLLVIRVSSVGPSGGPAQRRSDLDALSRIPGVESASMPNIYPYGSNLWTSGIRLRPDQRGGTVPTAQYLDDGTLLQTLGVQVVEGRGFLDAEYRDEPEAGEPLPPAAMLVTRTLAKRLFGGEQAIGRELYIFDSAPTRIVGVIEDLLVPAGSADLGDYDAMVFPTRMRGMDYMLRTAPEDRTRVGAAAVAALSSLDANRLVEEAGFLSDMRERTYSRDRAVVWLLVSVCVALLVVTALGIVGLASFWVQQRTRQIGIRRALGATRAQILREFQLENFMLASLGVTLGMVLAYAINHLLMAEYAMSRLPAYYLPIGALALWLLGQIAVYWPARRAASVPPAVATRSI